MEASLISRLEKAVARLEALGVGPSEAIGSAGSSKPSAQQGSSALDEWDRLLLEHLAPVKAFSQHVPPKAQKSMESFEKAFQVARRVFEVAAVAKKPDDPVEMQKLLAPVAAAMEAVTMATEGRTSCPHHLKVLAEAVAALGFLAYTGPGCGMSLPRQHVADSWQSAEFYANKLLMEFRGKDDHQVAWVRGLKSLVQQHLEQYVVRNCPTGLKFNPDGVALAAAMSGAGAPAAPPAVAPAPSKPAAGARPPSPPPGPPPKPLSPEELAGEAGPGGDASDIFKELSKGEGVTRQLRRVTSEMKTKHNPERSGAVPVAAGGGSSSSTTSGKKGQPSGPPRLELKGSKWVVENFTSRHDLVVENSSPKNSVYVYGCTDCVVQVQSKVNAITLDNCKRVGVVFSHVISSVEAVNCNSVQLQTTGTVPTITVEKTDGAQLYLSQACAADPNFQIVSAKSSSINVVVVPAEGDSSDPQEHPVPGQYISTFQKGKLVTVAAEHSGA